MEPRALELHSLVAAVDADGPPEIRWTLPPRTTPGRIGLLPGSFNPPTNAHTTLADAGRRDGMSAIVYVLSKRTVDKERITGLQLADRLLLLEQIARPQGDAVAFGNLGLYVDQAEAFRRLTPESELIFLVGHDKIVQIFDHRYYADRDAALAQLFAAASFWVAPREAADADDLEALLARSENRRFAGRVRPLSLPEDVRDASSTRVRQGLAHDVPRPVSAFLDRWRPFDPDGPYAQRAALLGAV